MFDRRTTWTRLLFLTVFSILGAIAAGGLVVVAGAKVLSLGVWIAAALAVTVVVADAWVQRESSREHGHLRLIVDQLARDRNLHIWPYRAPSIDPSLPVILAHTVREGTHWVRAQRRRIELGTALSLLLLAAIGYIVAYQGARSVLGSSRPLHFSPSETVQVITAISGLVTAVGLTIAAIIKAFAQLVDARANMVRAKVGLPPESESLSIEKLGDMARTTGDDIDPRL